MLSKMLLFELKFHLKQISFIIASVVFFALGMIALSGSFGSEEVNRNSPYVITAIVSLLSLLGVFATTICCANVVLRDRNHQMEEIIFTTAISRFPYISVRFIGLVTAGFLLLVFAVLGIALRSSFVDGSLVGLFQLRYFVYPLLVFGLPNVFFSTTLLFATAILTKNVRAIYAAGVLIYILYMLASIFGNSPFLATSNFKINDGTILPFLIDPFGLASFYGETKSWSDSLRNQQLLPLAGTFLINRVIWFTLSLLILLVSYRFFHFRLLRERTSKLKTWKTMSLKETPVAQSFTLNSVDTAPSGWRYHVRAFSSQFKIEAVSLFKHIPFMVMLLLWIFIFGIELKDSLFNGPFGMKFYPTTGMVMEQIRSMKLSLILLIFYAAEMVTREKSVNIQSLIYTTPIKNITLWTAKCSALFLLIVTLVTANIITGIVLQLTHHFYDIDWLAYLSLYYYSAFPLFLYVILIVFVQRLMPNKYLGMMLNLLVVFVCLFSSRFGIYHYLWRYAAVPEMLYSFFNGFGHYTKAFNWYMLYWASFAALLGMLTIALWQNEQHAIKLMPILRQLKQMLVPLTVGVFLLIGSGIYIFWQTNVQGNYQNPSQLLDFKMAYEKNYKKWNGLPQPIIEAVQTKVALFPEDGKYVVEGKYLLKNKSQQVIKRIWVSIDPSVKEFNVAVNARGTVQINSQFKQQWINLHTPLQPDDSLEMKFKLTVYRTGFMPFDSEHSLVENGSYIELEKFVPHFGYDASMEIEDPMLRKKMGLPTRKIEKLSDSRYHRIAFETTISAPENQHVVTVGDLKKTWKLNGRSYFHYRAPSPIEFMFALSAANYKRKTVLHKGVAIKLFYLEKQQYNLQRMLAGVKDALDYGGKNFAPYTHRQLAVAEIPQYRGAATAYPGLVFIADKINFLGDFSDQNAIDQSYIVTAHEVAHQWWANQMAPLRIAGAPTLTEALAKYTEIMVAEKKYGKMYLRKFFKDESQLYFVNKDRNGKEQTLAQAVDQPYVYYQKGGLVLYAIKEMIGEQRLNSALVRLLKAHAYSNAKATTKDLIAELIKEVNLQEARFIEDSFNRVMTYQLKLEMLNCQLIANGKYASTFKATTTASGADGRLGPISPMAIDIAAFNEFESEWTKNLKPIYYKKHQFNQSENTFTMITDQKPKAVAIDPLGYLLDNNLDDNVVEIR